MDGFKVEHQRDQILGATAGSSIWVVLRKVAVCHSPCARFIAPRSIPYFSLSFNLISLSNSRDQQAFWVNHIINTSIH